MTIRFVIKTWNLRKSLLWIFAKNYGKCHFHPSVKFRLSKLFAKSLEIRIIRVAYFKFSKPDSVGVKHFLLYFSKRIWFFKISCFSPFSRFFLDLVAQRLNIVYLGVYFKNASKLHVSPIHVCRRAVFRVFRVDSESPLQN